MVQGLLSVSPCLGLSPRRATACSPIVLRSTKPHQAPQPVGLCGNRKKKLTEVSSVFVFSLPTPASFPGKSRRKDPRGLQCLQVQPPRTKVSFHWEFERVWEIPPPVGGFLLSSFFKRRFDREREKQPFAALLHWLIFVCAVTRDQIRNLGVWG